MDQIIAAHFGYKRFGLVHTRELGFHKNKNIIEIIDVLTTEKDDESYFIEIPFHLHPSINITKREGAKIILSCTNSNRTVLLSMDKGLDISVKRGIVTPEKIGWYSEAFLRLEPASTLLANCEMIGKRIIKSVIEIS